MGAAGSRLTSRAADIARRTIDAQAEMSAPLRSLPTYLIVGAQRCGTTALHRALAAHPDVVPPMLHKGLHYFDVQYARGFSWYRGHFPFTAHLHLAGRRSGGAITGESTPYYIFHPLAPGRIATDLPDVRLVAMVRDPVERAWSAYAHERARGFETEEFEVALELEPARLCGEEDRIRADPTYVSHAHRHQAYMHRGQYVEQLRRIASLVGPQRLLVIDSHSFFATPRREYARILDFLGLRSWTPERFDRVNARPRAELDPTLRSHLQEHFRPYDDELALFLGWKPSWMT